MIEDHWFEKRKVASELNISNLSGTSSFDNESTFVPANAISEYEYNLKNKEGKYDFDIDSGSSNDMPETGDLWRQES